MEKVTVFGGSGFLGSHVCDRLTDVGYDVTIFDRFESNWLRNGQKMIIGDITNFEEVENCVKGSKYVYNFAALADLNEALSKPLDTVSINILGNVNVLEACVRNNVQRFIYASTVYVQSRTGGFYRCSKRAAEEYVEEYSSTYGLNYTILRYGSLYGPRSDSTNGLFRIVHNAVVNGVVKYTGNIDALREYIHVTDAAYASVSILDDAFVNESIVLTGQEPMKVLDLLCIINEILGINKQVIFEECTEPGHYIRTPYSYRPKIGKKFIPPVHVDLGQGLLELIEYVYSSNDEI